MLTAEVVTPISNLARRHGARSSLIDRILRLPPLAPDIVEAIINSREPDGISLAKLTKTLPEDWSDQYEMFLANSPS